MVVVKVRPLVVATQFHLGVNQKLALVRRKLAINLLSAAVHQIRVDKEPTTNDT